MFSRVLIANRGEIAVRIQRTLWRLGIEAVAVYSDADATAVHVRRADRAVRIGPAAALDSYLDVERIVEAALATGSEAVHPGYGFLSESPALARACAAGGVTFIGPGPEAMTLLADKAAAKDVAAAAGVPVLAGLSGEDLTDEEITGWAATAELPLLVKATAGGGGKGMRVVADRDELPAALASARREALTAFGDERLLVERYLQGSRHIEIQVIADTHGNVVHLGERECSLQRRHQKVIEESPSPVVDAELRERMGAAAVALARRCGYVNAGTVELIAERDDPGSFYFLEVNARLQVEHPVTEAVAGLDLVELQLRVAAGEPLGLRQQDVRLRGHAIEARLYAEDVAHGFLPATGRIVAYREPTGIRVDSGVDVGSEVVTDYDPMLAKLIVHGSDRRDALARLRRGLGEMVVLGPATNTAYLRALLARPEVRDGAIDTQLIERLGGAIAPPARDPVLGAVALTALLGPAPSDDPWDARDGWRQSGRAWSRARLAGPEGEIAVAVRGGPLDWDWQTPEGGGTLRFDGRLLEIGDLSRPLLARRDGDGVWLVDGASEPGRFELVTDAGPAGGGSAGGSLEAPMPGVVIDVRSRAGDEVAEGEVLVVLESMKMELSIQSPRDGIVAEIMVREGEQVRRGQPLIVLVAMEPTPG